MTEDDSETEILGTTTVTQRWRISLLKAVREEFEADGTAVEEGDRLVYKRRNGQIVVKPAE